jgi:hypothetical protein
MSMRRIALAALGAVLTAGTAVLFTGQNAMAIPCSTGDCATESKPCATVEGAWKGTVKVTTPAGPRTFESRIVFVRGTITEITSAPRQDPALGTYEMTSGLGVYTQNCETLRFTFTKYHHSADGTLLEMRTISEVGRISNGSYGGSATVRRFRPDGTPVTDATGNPIVFQATSSYTRIQP